jgi:imidazolonepropionase-like amidohydrolase
MHVHLSYARSSALPLLVANGVTSVRDMGSSLAELDRWRTQIADQTVIGPMIFRAGPILNGREFNEFQLAIGSAVEARMAVRTLQKAGVDFIKLHRQTSREAYLAAADEARSIGIPFAGHVPVTMTPGEASDARPASIEHTVTLFEGTFASANEGKDLAAAIARWRTSEADALFARFVSNHTPVDATLIALEHMARQYEAGSPDPRSRYIARSARALGEKSTPPAADWPRLAREQQPFLRELELVTGQMQRAGVTVLAGSDTSFLHPPGFSLHDELALLVRSGLTPADALRAATINAARLFPASNAGRIAAGAVADLILLDGNPLDDIRRTQQIAAVVARGRYFDRAALDGLLRDAASRAAVN